MGIISKIHRELWKCKIYFLENLRYIKYKEEIKDNRKYKGVGIGHRCFIIGNGPSLTSEDLDKLYLNNEITFAANKIYKMYDKVSWRPTYYCVCDTALYINCKAEIDALTCEKFFPLDIFDKHIRKKTSNIHLFSRQPFQFFNNRPKINPDLEGRLSEGGTITYHMLQIAMYMGFSEIILLGNDFNYSYGIGPDGKYFEAPSVRDHFEGDNSKMAVMPNLHYNYLAFESAKSYAEKHSIKIYNATRGGKLEIFERKNFDAFF